MPFLKPIQEDWERFDVSELQMNRGLLVGSVVLNQAGNTLVIGLVCAKVGAWGHGAPNH